MDGGKPPGLWVVKTFSCESDWVKIYRRVLALERIHLSSKNTYGRWQ